MFHNWYISQDIMILDRKRKATKMEAIKSEYDIQTQREILAFMNGETLDDIEKAKEQEIRKSNRRGMIAALVICGISIIVTIIHLIAMLV